MISYKIARYFRNLKLLLHVSLRALPSAVESMSRKEKKRKEKVPLIDLRALLQVKRWEIWSTRLAQRVANDPT